MNRAIPATANALHIRLTLPEVKKIPRSNGYNMDKIGIMEGMGGNDLVLGEATKKKMEPAIHRTGVWSVRRGGLDLQVTMDE